MVSAFIGLGSNQGDRARMIETAIQRLAELPRTRLIGTSTVLETDPVGPIQDQPKFLNAVAHIESELKPMELLDALLLIEKSLGRVREQRWGPRTIDLDLLLYGDERLDDPRLTVPHPEIANRPFLVEGLRELGVVRRPGEL